MGGGGSSARASAGMVEGHLPKIEADMSFRVMPRGGYPGLGGGAAAAAAAAVGEKSGLGDYGLGVDGGPLTGDEIEEEAEEEEEEGGGGGGEGNEHDADENDRCVRVGAGLLVGFVSGMEGEGGGATFPLEFDVGFGSMSRRVLTPDRAPLRFSPDC